MLEIENLTVTYGRVTALRSVSLRVEEGECVSVIGSNGAGKSSLLRAIAGVAPRAGGEIRLGSEPINKLGAHGIVRRGISLVPEGRRVFPEHSVEDNLRLGAFGRRRDRQRVARLLEEQYDRFPILGERRRQAAGTLSGGEQQMLAISRALMSEPQLLMLDEPSLGLAPVMVQGVFSAIRELNERGSTILLVDQVVQASLELASRAYVLKVGEIVIEGPGGDLLRSNEVREAYLGAAVS